MPLEDLIGEDGIKAIAGRPFGIDSRIKFKADDPDVRKTFVGCAGDLFDLEEYYKKLRENSNDIGTLNDFIKLALGYMPGDKSENAARLRDPHMALEQGEALLSTGYVQMARYVEGNRSAILDQLDAKQLHGLFGKMPLYNTGNKEHDRAIALREKVMQMSEAQKQGANPGAVVQKELAELMEKIPEEQKEFYERNPGAKSSLISALISQIQRASSGLFRLEDKSYDKAGLKKYMEDNYKVIENLMEDDKRTVEEKADLWDKNLKPQYVEIARELYGLEKKAIKMNKDPDKEERKAEAKKAGAQA